MVYIIHWYQVPAEFQHDRVQTELAGWFSMIIVPRIFISKPAFNLRIYMVPPSMTLMMRTERTSPVSGFLRCKIFSQEWDRPPPQVAMPFLFEMFSSFSISVPPESNTLSADSFAFILVYGFVLVALVIYVGIRLARRRWATLETFEPMMMLMILTQVEITPSTWWPVPGHFIELLDLRPECEHVAGQPRLHLSSSASSWAATLWSPWMSPNTTGCSKLLPWLKACFWISSVLKHDIWEGNAPQQNCPQSSNP